MEEESIKEAQTILYGPIWPCTWDFWNGRFEGVRVRNQERLTLWPTCGIEQQAVLDLYSQQTTHEGYLSQKGKEVRVCRDFSIKNRLPAVIEQFFRDLLKFLYISSLYSLSFSLFLPILLTFSPLSSLFLVISLHISTCWMLLPQPTIRSQQVWTLIFGPNFCF